MILPKPLELSYFNNDYWHLKIEFPRDFDDVILYKYFLKDNDGSEIFDGEENRAIDLSVINAETIIVFLIYGMRPEIREMFFLHVLSIKFYLPLLQK